MKYTEDTSPCWWWLASLFMAAVLVAILAGCEQIPSVIQPAEEGELTTIHFHLPTLDLKKRDDGIVSRSDEPAMEVMMGETTTRAQEPTTDEKKICNISVFQFHGTTHKLLRKVYKTINNASPPSVVDIDLLNMSKTNDDIYVVANKGDITNQYLVGITLSDIFKESVYTIDEEPNVTQGLAMIGYTSINVDTNRRTLIKLERLVAKVILSCQTSVNGTFKFTSVNLKNVPTSIYFSKFDSAVIPEETMDYTGVISNTPTEQLFTWYIPQNWRGEESACTSFLERGEINAPSKATYIEIKGDYTPTGGNSRAVIYQVYLGDGVAPGNFNVERNTVYAINVTIKGIDKDDARIIVGESLNVDELTANCYVVTKKNHWYRFKGTIQGNGKNVPWAGNVTTPGIDVYGTAITPRAMRPKAALVLWQTAISEGAGGNVVTNAYYSKSGYVVFETGTDADGNALIGVQEANMSANTVAWSWHIWKSTPENDPTQSEDKYNIRNNMTGLFTMEYESLMKRNLGAYNNNVNDIDAFGLFYQFGRKDPFVGAKSLEYNQIVQFLPPIPTVCHPDFKWKDGSQHENGEVSRCTYSDEISSLGGEPIIAYSINHPTHFMGEYRDGSSTGDWLAKTREYQNDNLWGNAARTPHPTSTNLYNTDRGKKTIYDPCPPGWRVPPQNTWTSFTKSHSSHPTFPGGNNIESGQYYQCMNVVGNESHKNASLEQVLASYNKGYTFYYQQNDAGPSVYYPSPGLRYAEGDIRNTAHCSSVRSSSTLGTGLINGCNLTVYNYMIYLFCSNARSNGFSVRCCRE